MMIRKIIIFYSDNYRLFYLVYYYSYLLSNNKKLPYPKFLFVHDWMMQHFGWFRKIISKIDINKFNNQNENDEIIYKSEVLENSVSLNCSCQLFNIKSDDDDDDNENSFKIIIHNLNDDSKIELPIKSEKMVEVSFPLEIIVIQEKGSKSIGYNDLFIIDFSSTKEKQKEVFINNYTEIQKDFNDFVTLSQHCDKLFDNKQSIDNNNNDIDNNENEKENFVNERDYLIYEIKKIPTNFNVPISLSNSLFSEKVASLCYSINLTYDKLIENMMLNYEIKDDDDCFSSRWSRLRRRTGNYSIKNRYMDQIIAPAYSKNTEYKFKFINGLLNKQPNKNSILELIFNRFEQRKLMDKIESNKHDSSKINLQNVHYLHN